MLRELVKLANHLDQKGLMKEADTLDKIIYKVAFTLPEQTKDYVADLSSLRNEILDRAFPNRVDPLDYYHSAFTSRTETHASYIYSLEGNDWAEVKPILNYIKNKDPSKYKFISEELELVAGELSRYIAKSVQDSLYKEIDSAEEERITSEIHNEYDGSAGVLIKEIGQIYKSLKSSHAAATKIVDKNLAKGNLCQYVSDNKITLNVLERNFSAYNDSKLDLQSAVSCLLGGGSFLATHEISDSHMKMLKESCPKLHKFMYEIIYG